MSVTTTITNQERHLHLVCFDVPYPVDYGGVFDVFYKIKSLSEAGIRIHLHCYEYGRQQQPLLNEFCEEVNYYDRLPAWKSLVSTLPHIVASRSNKKLLQRLQQDNYPVLMEGVHSSYFAYTEQLDRKRCFVRLPNVEYVYYNQLADSTASWWKKWYFRRESKLLHRYEKQLNGKADFWTLTLKDCDHFVQELGYAEVDYLPLYLPEFPLEFNPANGHYCLYHGNLAVPENEEAATWLLTEVFNHIEIPFVVAGKNPSPALQQLAHARNHTCIVANPGEAEMNELIGKAQVNILPSMNDTGIKLKLIHALYRGRHCLVNNAGAEGTGLEPLCHFANNAREMQQAVSALFSSPFTQQQFEEREYLLKHMFNNAATAQQMIAWIFGGQPTHPGSSMVGIA